MRGMVPGRFGLVVLRPLMAEKRSSWPTVTISQWSIEDQKSVVMWIGWRPFLSKNMAAVINTDKVYWTRLWRWTHLMNQTLDCFISRYQLNHNCMNLWERSMNRIMMMINASPWLFKALTSKWAVRQSFVDDVTITYSRVYLFLLSRIHYY